MSEPVKAPDILSDTTRNATESLADQFGQAKPFRHLVIDNFFTPEFCQSLLDQFPGFDDKHARDENGNIGRKATYDRVRSLGEPYVSLDDTVKSPEFLAWVSHITGIPELLYDPNYFGGGTHENRHGQDLDPHVDFNKHPTSGHYRRLNLIVYLNHEWQDDWGGAIEFHKNPRLEPEQNDITKVTPLFNRCVIFETTFWSWHGFERISLPEGDSDSRSRKSVALYFYSAERPKTEMVKPHSTIYVERPLPEHIQPGHTLSDDDYQRIKVLLARRDQHLERLYNNISSLTAHTEGLEHRLNSQTGATGEAREPHWKRFAKRIKAKLMD